MRFYRERVFPALAGGLWVWFLILDIFRLGDSVPVKFAAICLCCATALPGARTADGALVAAALCFTVGADWFLLVRNDYYPVGVGLFLIVQLLYALRLSRSQKKGSFRWWLWVRVDITLLFLFAGGVLFYLLRGYGLLLLLPLLYFSNLCINTLEAFALKKRVFAWGLLLFVCCDICVGLWNVSPFIPPVLGELARVGMWLFYLPSQVLIVLSQEQEKGCSHETAV